MAGSALLMGYYGARNVGDRLMRDYLLAWLERQGLRAGLLGENERALDSCAEGVTFVKNVPLLGEWAFPGAWIHGDALRVLRALKGVDHLVIGGGDLFRDDRGWKTFLYPFEKLVAAMALGTRVHLVNVGIGQPTTGYGRQLYRWFLPRCRTLLVRDQRSIQVCLEAGAQHAELIPDAVLAFDTSPSLEPPIPKPYLVVSLRFLYRNGKVEGLGEDRVRALASVLDRVCADRDLKMVFVPFQDVEGWNDTEVHRAVHDKMRCKDRCAFPDWSADLGELVGLFHHAEAVMAMPLHAGVIALRAGARLLLIPYDRKCWELASQVKGCGVASLEFMDDETRLFGALTGALDGPRVGGLEDARERWEDARLRL